MIPADPDFKLPQDVDYENCQISVEIANRDTDPPVSSWTEIGLAMVELNMACLTDDENTSAGGTTNAGTKDGIKITLRGYKQPTSPALGNSSSTATA